MGLFHCSKKGKGKGVKPTEPYSANKQQRGFSAHDEKGGERFLLCCGVLLPSPWCGVEENLFSWLENRQFQDCFHAFLTVQFNVFGESLLALRRRRGGNGSRMSKKGGKRRSEKALD